MWTQSNRTERFTMRMFLFFLIGVLAAARALAADPQIPIAIRDHQFIPHEIPVPAGTKIELVIKNEQAANAEFESTSLHREKIISDGGQISVFVGPLGPGAYDFFDDFNEATTGQLVVK
jgi:hypothetical protein